MGEPSVAPTPTPCARADDVGAQTTSSRVAGGDARTRDRTPVVDDAPAARRQKTRLGVEGRPPHRRRSQRAGRCRGRAPFSTGVVGENRSGVAIGGPGAAPCQRRDGDTPGRVAQRTPPPRRCRRSRPAVIANALAVAASARGADVFAARTGPHRPTGRPARCIGDRRRRLRRTRRCSRAATGSPSAGTTTRRLQVGRLHPAGVSRTPPGRCGQRIGGSRRCRARPCLAGLRATPHHPPEAPAS
jgi:hypothetical protein